MSRVAEQLSLTGIGAPPDATDRLFFAIFPSAEAAASASRIAQRLRSEHRLTAAPVAVDRLHVTLLHLGDYAGLPPSLVSRAIDAAAPEAVLTPPVPIAFDRALNFDRGKDSGSAVLRASAGLVALEAFQRSLCAAMTRAGLPVEKASFTPHMTLAYGNRPFEEEAVETVSWIANEFILVHSLLGRTRHLPLARWPLRGG